MKKLSPTLSDREIRSGWILLIAVFFCVPYLLSALNQQLAVPFDTVTLNLIYHTVNFVGCLTVFYCFLKKSALQLKMQLKSILLNAVFGACIYFILVTVLSLFILWLKPDFINLNDQNISSQLSMQWFFVAIGTVFMAPFTEELLFRGHVFGSLYHKSPAADYIISMCLFSLVHILGYMGRMDLTSLVLSFLQYLPAGWVMARAYARTNSIFTPILIHTIINVIGIYSMR